MSSLKRPGDSEGGTAKYMKVETKAEPNNGVREENGQGAQITARVPARTDVKPTWVMYKDGEPLAGLQRIYDSNVEEKVAEVIIPCEFMSSNNRRVKTRQIWGDGIYTGDSDIVAVLMHQGYFAHYLSHPPPQVHEFRALIRLLPPQPQYPSKARFVKSRTWSSTIQGCSYKVESCWLLTRDGVTVHLQPQSEEIPGAYPTVHTTFSRQIQTRSTGRHKLGGQEVSVQYNLCNEPWLKYTLSAIADRGLKRSQWTSSRMLDEVLLLETARVRYQIARVGETGSGTQSKDLFSLSKCKSALPMAAMRKAGVPLPPSLVEVLEENVAWEELKWGVNVLHVRGRELLLKRIHFMPITKPSL